MKRLVLLTFILMLGVSSLALLFSCAATKSQASSEEKSVELAENAAAEKPNKTLKAFTSKEELDAYLRELAKKQNEGRREQSETNTYATTDAATPAAKPEAKAGKDKDDSVTNNQHAGVDEGGIVKLHGDHLVILRRGRLFTVKVGDNSLQPVSKVDAFAPDINPNGTWYDEMLISRNTIAVIGYSYERGGTEIGLFNIGDNGELKYKSTYHLRSNDYYSSRNYASRLVDGKLIFYTPQYLWIDQNNPTQNFPAIRKWHKGVTNDEFQNIVAPTRVYKSANELDDNYGLALHTVSVCDLEGQQFKCEATGVIGPAGRVFYVSPESVYVWVTDWYYDKNAKENRNRSTIYKMPLTGGAPQALAVSGSPIDQFSFLESGDKHLNVLVRSDGRGETMWNSEVTTGDMALLRVPVRNFSDGTESAKPWHYRSLPKAEGYTVQNRFVGDYLLYGEGDSWGNQKDRQGGKLFAIRYTGADVETLPLEHSVDRIESLGGNAVVVGTRKNDLYFSSVKLGNDPQVTSSYMRKNATQGETRSHGFFYKPQDENNGVLGLPIVGEGRPGYKQLYEGSASILFLKNNSLKLSEIGALASKNVKQSNDNCKASCVDWYGNARPLFLKGRVFALLGYEIVEGNMSDNGIREMRRVNFSPGSGREGGGGN